MNQERYTPAQVEEALRQSAGIMSAAAAKLRLTREGLRQYLLRNPDLAEIRRQIVDETLDLAETKLLLKIKEGHMTALIFYLKTQGKSRGYIEGREVSGPNGGPIPLPEPPLTIDPSKLTLAERKALLAAVRSAGDDRE